MTASRDDEVVRALRAAAAEESARIVSTVIRITDDWDLAEDCLQDAFARALTSWTNDGVPNSPGAWLTTVAKNRAIDLLRRASAERRAAHGAGIERELDLLAREGEQVDEQSQHDRLALLFTCCHPALAADARVALALRTVVGMTVGEIARAFLVSEEAMQKRLVRARAKIKNAGIPFGVPPVERWPERMPAVLAVLYLLFGEGYSSTESERFVREPIAREAIRLQRLLLSANADAAAAPDPEIAGLLALMLFQHARRRSRADESGALIVLEDQDRALWDADELRDGRLELNRATRLLVASGEHPGPYYLQAAIASQHAAAPSYAATDFERIVSFYDLLAVTAPSAIVELNRAVAVAMARGPAAGLELIDDLSAVGELENYYLLHATRADLLRRLGRLRDALPHYERAHDLAPSPAERNFLTARMAQLRQTIQEGMPPANP
ncbi:MAG: sigma-70 family RNA polymerase sigma factor [Pseudolysinimonas sp.]